MSSFDAEIFVFLKHCARRGVAADVRCLELGEVTVNLGKFSAWASRSVGMVLWLVTIWRGPTRAELAACLGVVAMQVPAYQSDSVIESCVLLM